MGPDVVTNPVSWVLAGLDALFGWVGGSHAKERARQLEVHRQRNLARGWVLGQNRFGLGLGPGEPPDDVLKSLPPIWTVPEPFRGRARRRKVSDPVIPDVVRGPNAHWETKAQEASRRGAIIDQGIRRSDTGFRIPFPRRVPITTSYLGTLAMGIGDVVTAQQDAAIRARIRRQPILATNRRGAAAVRPVRAAGWTNRTGAASTRVSTPASSPQPATQPRAQPQRADTRSVAQRAATSPRTQTASAPSARTSTSTRTSPATRGAVPVAVPKFPLHLMPGLPSLFRSPLPGTRSPTPSTAPSSPSPLLDPLTQLNQGMLPSTLPMTFAQAQPDTKTRRDECKCDEKKEKPKERKPTCRNPVISRKVDGDILTTKVRLTCPQSRLKSLSGRTRRTRTSFPGLPSSIPGVGSFSPWG